MSARLRREDGTALITTIIVTAMMITLGFALLSVVDAQTAQTRQERSSEAAFNLAEATLNAQAFLLARNWPTGTGSLPNPAAPAAPCGGQTLTGTLADPPAGAPVTPQSQIQKILAQTYRGASGATTPRWWVTVCEAGGRSSWDESLLNGLAYDPSVAASPAPAPRRLWVRAEAHVDGRKRSVVALVQAGQAPALPGNLAVVAGTLGADLGNTLSTLTNGPLLGGVLGLLVDQDPIIAGNVGLRCSLLDAADLLNCVSGVFTLTSMTTLGPLLQSNDYVHFESNTAMSAEQLAQLRQQAQATSTYYGTTSAGAGTVANGAACLPANAAGKVVFIEKIGSGTGSCTLSPASTPTATALIVGAGGVRVRGGGTFTGVIYALRRQALAGDVADVRIEDGSRVSGGVFVDDNPALGSRSRGQVLVIPPPPDICDMLSPLLEATCRLLGLNAVLSLLNVDSLVAQLLPQLGSHLPAVVYNENAVRAVATFGDSGTVNGTFRQVQPGF